MINSIKRWAVSFLCPLDACGQLLAICSVEPYSQRAQNSLYRATLLHGRYKYEATQHELHITIGTIQGRRPTDISMTPWLSNEYYLVFQIDVCSNV
jgi:hypothetical protein